MVENSFKIVREKYKKQFEKFGRSKDALFWPKDRDNERFSAIARYIPCQSEVWTILDYGCGFGGLNQYLKEHRKDKFLYTGVDMVDEFINSNRIVEPEITYKTIADYHDIQENYDYIAIVGVFNMLYGDSSDAHKEIIKNTVKHLFSKCNKWILVNFMTDQVDFMQNQAYHQNIHEIYTYARNNLSKRIIIDQSYLPYEFSLLIYKDDERSSSDSGMYLTMA